MASSTPTVAKTRRVTELKKVCSISASGRPAVPGGVQRLHRRPERPLHDRVLQDVAHVGHGGVEVHPVEREPLGGVGLRAEPVAPLEALAGAAGDLLEAQWYLS